MSEAATTQPEASGEICLLELSKIKIPKERENVRQYYDERTITQLAKSIEERGLLTPLTVEEIDGAFELCSGFRRYKAMREVLGWKSHRVHVVIRRDMKPIDWYLENRAWWQMLRARRYGGERLGTAA